VARTNVSLEIGIRMWRLARSAEFGVLQDQRTYTAARTVTRRQSQNSLMQGELSGTSVRKEHQLRALMRGQQKTPGDAGGDGMTRGPN
jgi:hypothetical protein